MDECKNTTKKVNHLVVDTTGFIRNVPIQDIAEYIYTTPSVVKEVTSKSQLRRLVVLPYNLKVVEPHNEYISLVTTFSKKSGDYASLSATDIQVIALTYQLENEHVGDIERRLESVQLPIIQSNGLPSTDFKNISGFHMPKGSKIDKSVGSGEPTNDEVEAVPESENILSNISNLVLNEEEEPNDSGSNEEYHSENGENEQNILKEDSSEEDDGYADEDADDDDDSDWITPNNLKEMKQKILSAIAEDESSEVACLTTDFAMQNVLKRSGLKVVAVDGRVIKELRTFILRCYACFKTTSVMSKVFCPNCGNKTLKKVAVTTDENGVQQIHLNPRRQLTARGKRYSLPTFKGGKHSSNPILCEDQPLPQQRVTKMSRAKNNPLDDDYTAGFSPFVVRDVNSRAAMLGIRPHAQIKQWMRRNPNESVKPGGRKRK